MLGALCQVKGPAVFIACQLEILKSVSENLERNFPKDPVEGTEELFYKLSNGGKDKAEGTVADQSVS